MSFSNTLYFLYFQDGRLHSGDHIIQIGDVDVRGFGSDQVAQVLRQAGSHVRLIVARPINEPSTIQSAEAPIVPTIHLDDHLEQILSVLEKQDQMLIMKQEEMDQNLMKEGVVAHAQVHQEVHSIVMFNLGIPQINVSTCCWILDLPYIKLHLRQSLK